MAASLKVLVSFNGLDAAQPKGSLIEDANGNLFGTTVFTNALNPFGTVFEITNTATGYATTPTILVSFNGADGEQPQGGLIMDAVGDLFGTTSDGGGNNGGTVFEIVHNSTGYASTPTTLVNFASTDGVFPDGSLIADAGGNLFGTTSQGGTGGGGTVFEIMNTLTGYAAVPTVLVNFDVSTGLAPNDGLMIDANGNLFGTTARGPGNNAGTVFEIANTATGYASTPIMLVTFNGTNGDAPMGGLIADSSGNLIGTTSAGGANNDGTVFEIAKTPLGYAGTPITLVSFNGTDGSSPHGSLIVDANGNLFGTTTLGGANTDGTVFEIANTVTGYANTPTVLVDFSGANGNEPFGSLINDAAGNLFGTTFAGGTLPGGDGTVFEITGSGFITSGLCFCVGTRISTPRGEVPVERLAVGDAVMTMRGEARSIVWIGEGRVLATRGRRDAATPVIIRKGALAANVPHNDLRLTKGHGLYLDGVLIPAEFLVNHHSIVCLAKAHRCRGCKSHPATLAPAGSARGGSGGDEWSEALREKVPSGDQRAIRAAAQANTDEASKGSM